MASKRTALISVYHKEEIIKFAGPLRDMGWDIIASAGTAKVLAGAGITSRDVATFVGEPILGHRVVTYSREIGAALLARDCPEDRTELERLCVPLIDLVCVDLYPLEAAIVAPDASLEMVIEKTDVGGPAMLSAAAKGGRIVIADTVDRGRVLTWLKSGEPDRETFLATLWVKAYMVLAKYHMVAANYHSSRLLR